MVDPGAGVRTLRALLRAAMRAAAATARSESDGDDGWEPPDEQERRAAEDPAEQPWLDDGD